MTDKTTYRAGEMLPENVLHFTDQSGKKYPVQVRSDLDAHVEGDTLILTVHPGSKDAAVRVETGNERGLNFTPSPAKHLNIIGPDAYKPKTQYISNDPLSEIGQRLAEIEGQLGRLEFPDYD